MLLDPVSPRLQAQLEQDQVQVQPSQSQKLVFISLTLLPSLSKIPVIDRGDSTKCGVESRSL